MFKSSIRIMQEHFCLSTTCCRLPAVEGYPGEIIIMLMLFQVKLAQDQSSEPAVLSSSDTHDSHDLVDDDGGKPRRRSSSEAPAPPVSGSARVYE